MNTRPEFGDTVTGFAADDNDWTASGPRLLRPKRTVTGTVCGLYPGSEAARIVTSSDEEVCVRVTSVRVTPA
jgi:hypothetical protein